MMVRGDLLMTLSIPAIGKMVLFNGPAAKSNLFYGLRGSTLVPTSSQRVFVPNPFPPRNCRVDSSGRGIVFIVHGTGRRAGVCLRSRRICTVSPTLPFCMVSRARLGSRLFSTISLGTGSSARMAAQGTAGMESLWRFPPT